MSRRSLGLSSQLYDYMQRVGWYESEALATVRRRTAERADADMQLAPEQGAFLALLVRLLGVRRYLELGVFTGYSALAVASAMPPEGRCVVLDRDPETTALARTWWRSYGVDQKIELRLGLAMDSLESLAAEATAPFDLALLDADKESYPAYYERILALLRPGGLLVVDNTLWGGAVADPSARDAETKALRAFNEKVHADPRVESVLLPLGDGTTLVRLRERHEKQDQAGHV